MFVCKTKADVLAKIKSVHESNPGDGILAFQGFNHSVQSEDRSFITKDDLDAITKDRPLMVTHNTGHFIIVNSAAFALEGVTEETKDYPGGGHFQRDANGKMNGVCEESLVNTFQKYQPQPSPEDMAKILAKTLKESFARKGLTTIAEAWVPGVEKAEQALGLFELVEASGDLQVRIGFHPNVSRKAGWRSRKFILKSDKANLPRFATDPPISSPARVCQNPQIQRLHPKMPRRSHVLTLGHVQRQPPLRLGRQDALGRLGPGQNRLCLGSLPRNPRQQLWWPQFPQRRDLGSTEGD